MAVKESDFGGRFLERSYSEDESPDGADDDGQLYRSLSNQRNTGSFRLRLYKKLKLGRRLRRLPRGHHHALFRQRLKRVINIKGLKNNSFFYNVFILRFVLDISFRSSSFFAELIQRRLLSKLRAAVTAGRSTFRRRCYVARGMNLSVSANLVASALFGSRADAPFLSARHAVWAKKILNYYLPLRRKSANFTEPSSYAHYPVRWAMKTHIFSKRVFWGGAGQTIRGWPRFYYRWGQYTYYALW